MTHPLSPSGSDPQNRPKSTPPPVRKLSASVWPVLRLLLSAVLLYKAIAQVDWRGIVAALPHTHGGWLAGAALFLVASNACAGIRWGLLNRAGGFRASLWRHIGWYFAGSLINQGLPTTIGGDGFRALASTRGTSAGTGAEARAEIDANANPRPAPKLRTAIYIVALDRTLGLAGNSLLGAIGLIAGGAMIHRWASEAGWILLLAMLAGAILLALLLHVPATRDAFFRYARRFDIDGIERSTQNAWGFAGLFAQLPFAIAIHLLTLGAFWACLHACNVTVPLAALLVGMPALGLLLMLPLSVSGWGLRENTLAGVLALWGIHPSFVVLASLLYGAITLGTMLIGLPALLNTLGSDSQT